jgi:LPXTG-motif cell wall-anchored protein
MVSILAAVGVVLDTWVYIVVGVLAVAGVAGALVMKKKEKDKAAAKAARVRAGR